MIGPCVGRRVRYNAISGEDWNGRIIRFGRRTDIYSIQKWWTVRWERPFQQADEHFEEDYPWSENEVGLLANGVEVMLELLE